MDLGQGSNAGLGHQLIEAAQRGGLGVPRHVIEREHGVGLAAAEVGLEIDHGIAALARQPAHGAGEQLAQAVGQEGPAVELGRVAILGAGLALVHLGEVSGELRLAVAPCGDVGVRRDHLAPGPEPRLGRALERQRALAAHLLAALLVVDRALEVDPQPLDRLRLLTGRDRAQQTLRRVQRALGVLVGERLLVREVVAGLAQLVDVRALHPPEREAEHLAPPLVHDREQALGVPGDAAVRAPAQILAQAVVDRLLPARPELRLELALDERHEPIAQQIERAADPVLVGNRHGAPLLYTASSAWAGPGVVSSGRVSRILMISRQDSIRPL